MTRTRAFILFSVILGALAITLGILTPWLLSTWVSQTLTQKLGTPVVIKLHTLGLRQAQASAQIPSLKLGWQGLDARWKIHSWRKRDIEFEIHTPNNTQEHEFSFRFAHSAQFNWQLKLDIKARKIELEQQPFSNLRATLEIIPSRLDLVISVLEGDTRTPIVLKWNAPGLPVLKDSDSIYFKGEFEGQHPALILKGPAQVHLSSSGELRSAQAMLKASLVDPRWPKGIPNEFHLEGDATSTPTGFDVKTKILAYQKILARLEAIFTPADRSFRAQLRVQWSPAWPENIKAFSKQKNWFKASSGQVTLSAKMDYSRQTLFTSGEVHLDQISMSPWGIPIQGAMGHFKFKSLWPPELQPHTLKISRIGATLPLEDVSVSLNLNSKLVLSIKDFFARWANGTITSELITADLIAKTFEAPLRAEHLSMQDIFSSNPALKLKARGSLSGTLTSKLASAGLIIDPAELHSDGPGWIHYGGIDSGSSGTKITELGQFEALLSQGEQALVFKALDNFNFDHASLRIHRTNDQDLTAHVELKGRNPDLARMPFQFGINVSGKVEETIRQTVMRLFVNDESFWQNSKKSR